jgi:hypothetical protein
MMCFQGDMLEARVGIEPTHKGFADLSLTTWVPRLNPTSITKLGNRCQRSQHPHQQKNTPMSLPLRCSISSLVLRFALLARIEPTLPVASG